MTISSPVTNNNNNDRAYLESYPCPPLMPVYDARHEKFLDGLSNAFYETYKTVLTLATKQTYKLLSEKYFSAILIYYFLP